MNQYPVIFLTFKNIDGLNFQRAYDQLVYEIGSLFEEHSYLTDCEQLSENERQMFRILQIKHKISRNGMMDIPQQQELTTPFSHIRKPIKSQFSISDNSPSKGTNN